MSRVSPAALRVFPPPNPMGTLTPRANSGKWKIDHHQCGCYLCFSPPNGTIAEERVQRRLAAILCADVVGYSRLMGADEEKDPRRSRGRQGRIDRSDDAVRYAVVVQQGMEDHNTNLPESERIQKPPALLGEIRSFPNCRACASQASMRSSTA